MSASHPQTLAEWRAYTDNLDGAELIAEAKAANCASFVRMLQEEGYPPEDIHAIFLIFAARLRATGLRPPGNGLYDYHELT